MHLFGNSILKKRIAAMLILFFAIVSFPAFAGNSATTFLPEDVVESSFKNKNGSGYTINYDMIPRLVERNLEVLKAKNSLDSLYSSDVELSKKLWDAQKSYADAKIAYEQQRQQIESLFPDPLPDNLQNIKNELLNYYDTTYESQFESAEQGIKSLKYNITALDVTQQSSALAIVSTKQQKITAAQQAFLNYYSLREKKAIAENQLGSLERQITVTQAKLDRKLVSQSVLDTYEEAKPQIELAIDNFVTAMKQNELALKSAIGLSASDKISYGQLPEFVLEQILDRDRVADRNTYLGRSAVIENARLGIGKAQVDYAFGQTDTPHGQTDALMTYEQAVESATMQFEAAFDNLVDSYTAYKTSIKKVNTLKKEVSKLEIKFAEGTIARNTLLNKKDDLTQAQHDLRAQKIDLCAMYQSYVNGLLI